MFRDAGDFTENENIKTLVADKKIYVQGSIDLVIKDSDGNIILCDYKTDRIDKSDREDKALLTEIMRNKHGNQLEQYSYAIEKIFGKAPIGTYIYLIDIGETVKIK